MRTSHTGTSASTVTVRSPPNISSGSALKLPESHRMTQSRVWLTVWVEPGNEMPSSGHHFTSVPVRSHHTTDGRMPNVGDMTGSSLVVHRPSRSGSATGCAEEKRNGRTVSPNIDDPPQLSTWPTSATYSSVPGWISTGRPASQVVNSRSPHGSGAVFDELGAPNGEV